MRELKKVRNKQPEAEDERTQKGLEITSLRQKMRELKKG